MSKERCFLFCLLNGKEYVARIFYVHRFRSTEQNSFPQSGQLYVWLGFPRNEICVYSHNMLGDHKNSNVLLNCAVLSLQRLRRYKATERTRIRQNGKNVTLRYVNLLNIQRRIRWLQNGNELFVLSFPLRNQIHPRRLVIFEVLKISIFPQKVGCKPRIWCIWRRRQGKMIL